jgi:ABC-2 type transport system permease protein
MNLLNAWTNNTLIGLKLTFRDRQAIFWTYAFPLFFLFLFAGIFARGRAAALLTMLPGLLCISAMSSGLFGIGVTLPAMRERGILRRYRLAPISSWMIITSGIASNLLVSLSTLLMQIALAKIVYKIEIAGSVLATLVMLIVGALAFFSLGFVVASLAENVRSATVLCNLLFFPLMFLGGAAFPMQFLPPRLQDLARVLPSNYMVDGLYRVMKEGAGIVANLKNLAVLLLSCAVSLVIAAKLFRWEASEKLPLKRKAWAAVIVAIFVGAALFVKR